MLPNSFHNPLLDDDDDELAVIPSPSHNLAPRTSESGESVVLVPEARAPRFGEKGFGKGRKKQQPGTPRSRATINDAPLLAFLNEFQLVDTETATMVTRTAGSPVSAANERPTANGMYLKLRRLEKLGLVKGFWITAQQTHIWGVTEAGIAVARRFGYVRVDTQANVANIKDWSASSIEHYRRVALVAAHFLNGDFEKQLGIGPVKLDQLHSAPRLIRDAADTLAMLKRENDKYQNFGKWRSAVVREVRADVAAGDLDPADIIEQYPELRTIGQSVPEGEVKPLVTKMHTPDLVVDLDQNRTSIRGKSILVEVELSKKGWKPLGQILRTMKAELDLPIVYERIVYFTDWKEVETLIKKVDADKKVNTGLVASGKLKILPLTDRNGKIIPNTRPTIEALHG